MDGDLVGVALGNNVDGRRVGAEVGFLEGAKVSFSPRLGDLVKAVSFGRPEDTVTGSA